MLRFDSPPLGSWLVHRGLLTVTAHFFRCMMQCHDTHIHLPRTGLSNTNQTRNEVLQETPKEGREMNRSNRVFDMLLEACKETIEDVETRNDNREVSLQTLRLLYEAVEAAEQGNDKYGPNR